MRSGDKPRLSVLRMALAGVKQREVDTRRPLDDAGVQSVIERMIKQGRDSVSQYRDGGRQDLVDKEEAEIKVLQTYLPQPLSDAELDTLIARMHRGGRRHERQGPRQGHGRDQDARRGPRRHEHGQRARTLDAHARLTARPVLAVTRTFASLRARRIMPVHGRTNPQSLHRRADRSRRHRRGRRRARRVEARRQQLQRPVPVPRREDAVVHGQPVEGLLSLLRLQRAWHCDRLPDGLRQPRVPRGRRGARRDDGPRGAARDAPAEPNARKRTKISTRCCARRIRSIGRRCASSEHGHRVREEARHRRSDGRPVRRSGYAPNAMGHGAARARHFRRAARQARAGRPRRDERQRPALRPISRPDHVPDPQRARAGHRLRRPRARLG